MFVLTLENHPDGVYSVFDEAEDRVIPIFIEGDDAERYLMMMEIDDDYPPMQVVDCLLYTSPSPRDQRGSRMPSSA